MKDTNSHKTYLEVQFLLTIFLIKSEVKSRNILSFVMVVEQNRQISSVQKDIWQQNRVFLFSSEYNCEKRKIMKERDRNGAT
jgi:hypothetical protein